LLLFFVAPSFGGMASITEKRSAIIALHKTGKTGPEIFNLLRNQNYTRKFIWRTISRFLETGSVNDKPRSGRPKSVSTRNLKQKVKARIQRNPRRSLRKMSKELRVNRETLRKFVRKKLNLRSYKYHEVQLLTPDQKRKRLDRCRTLRQRFANGAHLAILFSDEKIFTIEQTLNRQNDRILAGQSADIPRVIRDIKRTQKPASVMVWAGMTSDRKLPLVFVEKGVKLNAHTYGDLILRGALKPWANRNLGGAPWVFQQDSAPSHSANLTQDWLRANVPDFISKDEWPPCSPDLNPLDFSIWSILEAQACATSHKTVDNLKRALRREWAKIPPDILRAAADSFYHRLSSCIRAKGGHFE